MIFSTTIEDASMGAISYLGDVRPCLKPVERITFMQDMGKLWNNWPAVMEDSERWRWGVHLSHFEAADRYYALMQALCDVVTYENTVHAAVLEARCAKWDSIIDHILEQAEYCCTKNGVPVGLED